VQFRPEWRKVNQHSQRPLIDEVEFIELL